MPGLPHQIRLLLEARTARQSGHGLNFTAEPKSSQCHVRWHRRCFGGRQLMLQLHLPLLRLSHGLSLCRNTPGSRSRRRCLRRLWDPLHTLLLALGFCLLLLVPALCFVEREQVVLNLHQVLQLRLHRLSCSCLRISASLMDGVHRALDVLADPASSLLAVHEPDADGL